MKISKIAAIKCHIVRTKCTKFDFRWGSAPNPVEGAYRAPQSPIAAFKGPTANRRGRKKEGQGREGKGGEGLAYSRRTEPRKTYGPSLYFGSWGQGFKQVLTCTAKRTLRCKSSLIHVY